MENNRINDVIAELLASVEKSIDQLGDKLSGELSLQLSSIEQSLLDIDSTVEDSVMESVEDALGDVEGIVVDAVEASISSELVGAVSFALNDYFSGCNFTLPDGTVLAQRPKLKVQNPERTKLLVCYGGLRVDKYKLKGQPDRYRVWVQTAPSSWDSIAVYDSKDEAKAAMSRIIEAMKRGEEYFDL